MLCLCCLEYCICKKQTQIIFIVVFVIACRCIDTSEISEICREIMWTVRFVAAIVDARGSEERYSGGLHEFQSTSYLVHERGWSTAGSWSSGPSWWGQYTLRVRQVTIRYQTRWGVLLFCPGYTALYLLILEYKFEEASRYIRRCKNMNKISFASYIYNCLSQYKRTSRL